MSRTLRVVSYAVNGGGVGHLNRLIAINRWLRRYASYAGARVEPYFLTSSEADGLLLTEKFASFKIPSKTVAAESGLGQTSYLALAKQWVWHSLALIRPDVLIVDTWPRGSFGELLSALDLCKNRVFVYRPARDEVASSPDFQAMLPLYDLIVVPETAEADVPYPPEVADKVRYVGPVMIRERAELLSRTEARDRLGVYGDRIVVYVSAGGGGDPTAEDHLLNVCTALIDDERLHIVVGAGPLYRGRVLSGERLTWLAYGGAAELMPGFDLAVCAAGYNTFHELMFAGVPTVFVPQAKLADEQARRAQAAVQAGAAVILEAHEMLGQSLERSLEAFYDRQRRKAASDAARNLVAENHARHAALEILRLMLPEPQVLAAKAAVGDELLAAARDCKVGHHAFIEVARALALPHESAHLQDAELAAELMTEVIRLMRVMAERAIPVASAIRVLGVLAHKLGRAPIVERAQAALVLLPTLAAFGDWPAALSLLKVANGSRDGDAETYSAELAILLNGLRSEGRDAYAAIEALTRAQEAP